MNTNEEYLYNNQDQTSNLHLDKNDEELFMDKLCSLAKEYNLEAPVKIDDEDNDFDYLYIIKAPNDMLFKNKITIWRNIVESLREFSVKNGILKYYKNSGIILDNCDIYEL